MPFLSIGGVAIPIAPGGVKRDRPDAVDRARAFDNTYRASATGGAARDFHFSTPPIARALADTYEPILSNVVPQLCAGDVLSLSTMCCTEITDWHPVVTAQGTHAVVIDFILHEVQGARVLLKYAPGDTIAGEAFTRSTTAYQINNASNPASIAINTKRDGHFPTSVIRTLLMEDARTNALTAPTDLSNAAWTKVNAAITTGVADPAGGTAACTITASASDASVRQFLADAASLVRTNSVWLRRRTGSGTINLYNPLDASPTAPVLTASWQKFTNTGGASVSRKFEVIVRTSGDAIDFWIGQLEDGAFASSTVPTAAATRGADSYSLPFTEPPKEMTVYVKFIESGTTLGPGGARLWQISSGASAAPQFLCYLTGGLYSCYHNNNASAVSSALPNAPVVGDTVEIVARLFGDGSVDITQSINGGAATVGAQTAPNQLAIAWSGLLLWLNSEGTVGSRGFAAFQSFKIVAGARSLAEMRAA